MIVSVFLNIFFSAVSYLLGFLPTVTISTSFVSAITTATSYISGIYAILPFIVGTILAVLAFDVAFESGYLFYKIIYWVIRRFPTQS